MIYLLIFVAKVLEIALGTLRMIVVANGKKWLGAFLQLGNALVWIFSTGVVLTGINEDWLKIAIFAIGSFAGSYVGSFIEEKLAMGSNLLTCITSCQNPNLAESLRTSGYAVTIMKGLGMEDEKAIYLIMTPRKKRHQAVLILKKYDPDCMIVSESAVSVNGGYRTSFKRSE